ncbi:MAG TPA: hypothetical protein VK705_02200 [Ferruginibacter sp.]|jgi:hypothetical protein|nr:hypothetical protein [Ferruginibacter sp.]
MNYIKHLAGFFERVAGDERLNPTHISMYVSLFQFWNASRFQNPISISRNELMRVSKISAKATYHKCMRELNDFGYLHYKPSYNPFKGSLVYLFNFQTATEQALVTGRTKNETSVEQAQEPYINNSNIINQTVTNKDKQAQKNDVQNLDRLGKKEKSSAKKERNAFVTPRLNQVQEYFASQKHPAVEAEKFFNYFQSNGWLVGGRTKMKDWQAAARNWILNSKKFTTSKPVKPRAKHLHASTNKNYSEPL